MIKWLIFNPPLYHRTTIYPFVQYTNVLYFEPEKIEELVPGQSHTIRRIPGSSITSNIDFGEQVE